MQDSIIHAHGIICCEMFGKRKKTSRRLVRFYGFRKSSNIVVVWKLSSLSKKSRSEESTLYLHLKQNWEWARSCFVSYKFLLCFALHSNDLKLGAITFKVHHRLAVLGWYFGIWVCGICEYGDVILDQAARTSRDDLLKAVYIEEKLDLGKKCKCKLTLYNSILPSCAC